MKRETIERLRGCTDNASIGAESFVEQLGDLRELHGLDTETLVSAKCERWRGRRKWEKKRENCSGGKENRFHHVVSACMLSCQSTWHKN